jgi:hypothetical protein
MDLKKKKLEIWVQSWRSPQPWAFSIIGLMLGFAKDPYSVKAHSLRLYPTQKHAPLFTPIPSMKSLAQMDKMYRQKACTTGEPTK